MLLLFAVIPASISFNDGVSVNGSSSTGCSSRCSSPTSNVLYDGHIPTLTGLQGDMWASQLLVLEPDPPSRSSNIVFDFTQTGVERVDVVMFNCPEWHLGIGLIRLLEHNSHIIKTMSTEVTSCSSLVRVCLSATSNVNSLTLLLTTAFESVRIYLAEVTFYGSNGTCPPEAIVVTPELPPITSMAAIPTSNTGIMENIETTESRGTYV